MMLFKQLKNVISISFILFCTVISAYAQTGISFFDGTLEEALEEAKAKNKLVFVDCYTTWCGPCKWMDKNVFTEDSVGDFYNENFVNYKLDMENGEGPDIANRYSVKSYPTFLFVSSDGDLAHRAGGAKPVGKFIAAGKMALDPEKRISAYIQQYDEGKRTPAFMIEYANVLRESGSFSESQKIADEYLATQNDHDLLSEANWEFMKSFINNSDRREFKYVLQKKEQFEESFGEQVADFILGIANRTIRTASLNEDQSKFESLLTLIKNNSKNPDKAVTQARMNYYFGTKNWDSYAEAAVAFMDNKYYQTTLTKKEITEKSEEMGQDYGKILKQMSAGTLNNSAWTFYENIDEPELLEKALAWIEESVSIDESYYNLDTYAALLFKTGNIKKGKKVAGKAIAKAEEDGIEPKSTKELIEKY